MAKMPDLSALPCFLRRWFKMFAQKRREIIAELVNTEGEVLVKELSARFFVTEDCIRKDLAILEREGLLSRLYGGAVKSRSNPHETDFAQRLDKNPEIKHKIALAAFSLKEKGDTVFIDVSTTSAELARLIAASDLEVTVVSS